MFTSPLLYHHSLPTVRTVIDPETGRRVSVVDTPKRNPYTYRRNTIAVVPPGDLNSANPQNPSDPVFVLRRSSVESAPAFNKGSTMSKVVRSVKNVTKGYSSVQVKVRNGTMHHSHLAQHQLIAAQPPRMTHGVLQEQIWQKSLL
jgi:hypothetical protein